MTTDGQTVTKTGVYRDTLLLARERIQMQKQSSPQDEFARSFAAREEGEIENAIKTLEAGFDPTKFDEALPNQLHGVRMYLPPISVTFSYFLPAQKYQGISYVGIYIMPHNMQLTVLARTPGDERTVFEISNISIEKIFYEKQPSWRNRSASEIPQISILGKFCGMPVRVRADKERVMVRCAENPDDYVAGGRVYYTAELDPGKAER